METVQKAKVTKRAPLPHIDAPDVQSPSLAKLNIVIPCFNEEDVLKITIPRLAVVREEMIGEGLIHPKSQITFVDDGSTDRSWQMIETAARQANFIRGIKLSGNKGQQNALLAAIFHVKGDAVITLDADLQDDVAAIRDMVLKHAAGAHVVYGVRSERDKDSVFKRVPSEFFYRGMRWLGVDVVFNHAEYRLLSRQAINALRQYREVNLFLRGIVPMLGFRQEIVYYARAERCAGQTKYPFRKLVALAWEALSSFSATPLHLITMLGFMAFGVGIAIGVWAALSVLVYGQILPPWLATVLPLTLATGLQMLSLGIVGEYVAKIYMEVKRRPRYIIEKTI